MLWVQTAREIPPESSEALLHWMALRALLFARSASVVARPDACRLLSDERLKGCPELTKHLTPVRTPLRNCVELLFHPGCETKINKRGEVSGQKIAHCFAESCGTKSIIAVSIHVLSLLDALNDRRVC